LCAAVACGDGVDAGTNAYAIGARIADGTEFTVGAWARHGFVDAARSRDALVEGADVGVAAEVSLGGVDHDVVEFVADVRRAGDAIGEQRCGSRLAVGCWVTVLGAIAEKAIVATGVIGGAENLSGCLDAHLNGTVHAVVEARHGDGDAAHGEITGLGAVAVNAIAADRVVCEVADDVQRLIAGVLSAIQAVVEGWDIAAGAANVVIAHLKAIAEESIVAELVIGDMFDDVGDLITVVFGAGDAVIEAGDIARQAAVEGVAELFAVAVEPIVAEFVVGDDDHLPEIFVA